MMKTSKIVRSLLKIIIKNDSKTILLGEENDENNYEEDEEQSGLEFYDNENPGVFRIASTSIDREEEVLMIQYSDPDLIPEPDSISRMVHWNPNGIQFGIFDEIQNPNNDVAGKYIKKYIFIDYLLMKLFFQHRQVIRY